MSKWLGNARATFENAFPERQIYHRSGGTVRYISVSPWQQAMMAVGAVALVSWTVFATGSYVLGGGVGVGGGSDDYKELAKYERWVQELRAKDALSRTLLEERTDEYEKTFIEFEERFRTLEHMYKSLNGEVDLEEAALKGDGSSLLVQASIEEADNRQSREKPVITASMEVVGIRAQINAVDQLNASILDAAESESVERAEKARGILQLTSVGGDRLQVSREMGGPVVEYSSLGISDASTAEEAAFQQRVAQVAARMKEAQYYESVVESLPLAEPVGAAHRRTSPYGLRVDPFTKRPNWHNGMDIAAFYNAPIIAAGPGKIIFAGYKGGYGRTVDIDHGQGFTSRYAHMKSIAVKLGDEVAIGDKVGAMGSSGRSTGPHLHYEVLFNNKQYDPLDFLKAGKHVYEGK